MKKQRPERDSKRHHVRKACRLCGLVQPLAHFYKAVGTSDGHRSECKTCANAARIEYSRIRAAATTKETIAGLCVIASRRKRPLVQPRYDAEYIRLYGSIDVGIMHEQGPYREMMELCERFEQRARNTGIATAYRGAPGEFFRQRGYNRGEGPAPEVTGPDADGTPNRGAG